MEIDWSVEVTGKNDCSLVCVLLSNPSPVPRRVRLENRLDGPVAPPRRHGVPERGWDETGYEATVPANGRLAVGYACPAPIRRPPVELVRDEPTSDRDDAASQRDRSPETIRRRLGSGAPPRDAVPSDSTVARNGAAIEATAETESGPSLPVVHRSANRALIRSESPLRTDESGGPDPTPRTGVVGEPDETDGANRAPETTVPDAVDDWFDEIERRIDHADALTDASVSTATRTLAAVGGLDAAESLPGRIDEDVETLAVVAARAEALLRRAESTDVPVDALGRLA